MLWHEDDKKRGRRGRKIEKKKLLRDSLCINIRKIDSGSCACSYMAIYMYLVHIGLGIPLA